MGSKPRMSEKEYLKVKAEIEDTEKEIIALREKKNQLKKRVYWYEYTKNNIKTFEDSIAFQMFGKRLKDLTHDELREYNKQRARISRKNRVTQKIKEDK